MVEIIVRLLFLCLFFGTGQLCASGVAPEWWLLDITDKCPGQVALCCGNDTTFESEMLTVEVAKGSDLPLARTFFTSAFCPEGEPANTALLLDQAGKFKLRGHAIDLLSVQDDMRQGSIQLFADGLHQALSKSIRPFVSFSASGICYSRVEKSKEIVEGEQGDTLFPLEFVHNWEDGGSHIIYDGVFQVIAKNGDGDVHKGRYNSLCELLERYSNFKPVISATLQGYGLVLDQKGEASQSTGDFSDEE